MDGREQQPGAERAQMQDGRRDRLAIAAGGSLVVVLLVGLAGLSRRDFLLFHAIVEVLAVVVAGTIFSIGWNARKFVHDNLLLALSTGYLVVGALDILHVLSYQGMGIFRANSADLPTQLWVGARWIESAAYVIGMALLNRRTLRAEYLLLANCAAGLLIGSLIFLGDFPACYVAGEGLTRFKVFSEIGVSLGFALAAVVLWIRRRHFDRTVILLLLVGLGAKILAELAFTVYVDVTGTMNAAGHLLKLVSEGFLYLALVRWSLRQPYETLFKELARSEEELKSELLVRRRTEAQLQEAKNAAEAASGAKSEFLANMSHEIRTPMHAVIGMTDLVLEGRVTGEQRELLAMARASARALLDIINDVLDVSRIEAGKLALHPTRFDLHDVVEDAIQAMAVRAQDKKIELVLAFEPGMPRYVIGDAGRIRQMLVNLVSNAIKFTETGEVVARVARAAGAASSTGPGVVSFSVVDTGPGIPADKRERLFKSFSQVDGSITRRYGGTGLGLAITKHLAEQMGGAIEVDSAEGRGSTFTLTVPLEVPDDEPPPAPALSTSASGWRVLVVDDNPHSRGAIVDALRAMGAAGEGAPGGDDALEALRTATASDRPFDVVLIDVQMPGVDGYQTLARIRQDDALGHVRVLMMTARTTPCDRSSCAHAAVGRCLVKPMRRSTLFQALQALAQDSARDGQGEDATGPAASSNDPSGAESSRPMGERGHILVAEDNRVNQRLVEVLLSRRGWYVTCVGTGQDAIETLAGTRFDAVLMDVQMPVCDGLEATRRIREAEREKGGHVPIIGLTAHAMKSDADRCLEAGMDAYLSKPIDVAALESTIVQLVTNRQRADVYCPSATIGGLREMVKGDQDAIREIIQAFLEDYPAKMQGLAKGIEGGDAKAVERFAHSLKGSISMFGAGEASRIAAELECMGRDRQIGEAVGAFSRLEVELDRVRRDLMREQG